MAAQQNGLLDLVTLEAGGRCPLGDCLTSNLGFVPLSGVEHSCSSVFAGVDQFSTDLC